MFILIYILFKIIYLLIIKYLTQNCFEQDDSNCLIPNWEIKIKYLKILCLKYYNNQYQKTKLWPKLLKFFLINLIINSWKEPQCVYFYYQPIPWLYKIQNDNNFLQS